MGALITLASVALASDLRAQGLTLDKMGLAGVTPDGLQKIVAEGF